MIAAVLDPRCAKPCGDPAPRLLHSREQPIRDPRRARAHPGLEQRPAHLNRVELGEYGGRYRGVAPLAASASATPTTRWSLGPSITTMSPWRNVGPSSSARNRMNLGPSMVDSRTRHARTPSRAIAPMIVRCLPYFGAIRIGFS